jgi:cobalamin biosynthesis protein CobW
MPLPRKIPATVVTGFLGAGKTSLIRHLIETANGRRLALIVNEFGDLGVDGEALKACGFEDCGDDDIVELTNGCICCTVADDFLPTIRALIERETPPDHIVIETSGLALPKPLVRAFAWPEVRSRVTVDGVIAVVDAAAVAEGRFAPDEAAVAAARLADPALDHDSPLEELFEDQLGAADIVVVNKCDLLEGATLARVRAEIGDRLRHPAVKAVEARHGRIPASVLLGLAAAAEDDLDARPSHHDGEEDHDHDEFASFVVELPPVPDPEAFAARLVRVAGEHDVLRMKGFLDVPGKAMRLQVQAGGRRVAHHYDRPWRAGEARAGRIVVIGDHELDQAAIARAVAGG